MACDTILKPRQTQAQRAEEIRKAKETLDEGIRKKRIKILVDKRTGAIAFQGFTDEERNGMSDACAYRYLITKGSASTKMELMRAEQAAGRVVSKATVHAGVHSHDGGKTWHEGHK